MINGLIALDCHNKVSNPSTQTISERHIRIYALRGFSRHVDVVWEKVKTSENRYNPCLRNGHVGIQIEKDGPIWGLSPDIPASSAWGKVNWDIWQENLKLGWSVPANIKNDTEIFQQANRVSGIANIATDDGQD